MRLTDIAIRQLPFAEKGQIRVRDNLLPGFGVTVGTNTKTFFVMYGPERKLKTLGKWPSVSLRDARSQARLILATPKPPSRSVTFSEARTAFLADCSLRLRKSTVDRYHFALKDVRAKSLDSINPNTTDPNQLKALKAMYNWCIDRGLADKNPFIRRKVVFNVRERLLTHEEIATIWAYDNKPYSDIVKLLILTGQRRNQIWRYQSEWNDGEIITFPSTIMKNKAPHTIPVTGYGDYLPTEPFSFNSWSKSKARMDRITGISDYVLHDFRRYFSTTMAMIGVPLHITEHILDHRSQVTGVAAVYNRYSFLPEMREAILKYEAHIGNLTGA